MNTFLPFALLGIFLATVSAVDDAAAKRAYVMCIIETQLSSQSCKTTAKAQAANNDESTACATLETFKLLLGIVGCTTDDYNLLHKVLCEKVRVPCNGLENTFA
ncbi:hypothetical protein Btru_037945 [Bulinus truncatus]|nr:hypothetical protein Btru_037945 [Bulinus truncatus]